jgi:uncharacterized delta-60 repeat protein
MLWGYFNYTDNSGKIMITGSFTEMGGYPRTSIARLNANGSVDDTFNAAVTSYGVGSGYVNNCILLNPGSSDSQMLICGDFAIDSDSGLYYGLARLNANGTVDSTFAHTFTTGDGVQAMARQADGKIMVGGYAMKVNGHPDNAYYLVRLDGNGNVDTNYMLSAPGGNVTGLWPDQGAPGQAALFGTIPRFTDPTHVDHMVVLSADGKTRVWGIGDGTVNGTILNMTWQGGNLVIVGAFTQVLGESRNGIARLIPGGAPNLPFTLDPSFTIGSGANGHVKRVTDDGAGLVLNGYFNSFNGTPCGYMVRLNYNGTVDGTFNPGGAGADDRIWNLNRQSDGTWVALGAFRSFNGSPRQCLARLTSTGGLDSKFASFTAGSPVWTPKISDIQDSPQGLYIGGTFSGYGGKLHSRVARLHFDGTPDNSFRAGIGGAVYSMCRQEDAKLIVAGHFGVGTGYVGCTSLARLNLDGTMDLTFKPVLTKADGSLPDLYMVERDDDGKIIIAGDFAKIADANHVMQFRSGFARLNSDGSLDPTFTAQINIPDGANIKVNAGGKMGNLFPMGGYVLYKGSPAGFYTRLTSSGDLDPTFGPAGAPAPHVNLFNGEVRCGTDIFDGRVLIGGDFTAMIDGTANPPQVGHIARFTYDGLLDTTFAGNPGANNSIYVMERQWPYSKILIGGTFTAYKGKVRNYLACINPDGFLDNGFNPVPGANGPVYAIAYNEYICEARIGGAFTTFNNVSRPRIAQIFANPCSFNPGLLLLLDNSPIGAN